MELRSQVAGGAFAIAAAELRSWSVSDSRGVLDGTNAAVLGGFAVGVKEATGLLMAINWLFALLCLHDIMTFL